MVPLQLLTEFMRVIEKKQTLQHFYHEPWGELEQKIIQISEREENLNVIRTMGLAGEDMSESK